MLTFNPKSFAVGLCLAVFASGASAATLVNSDFESGTLAGWSVTAFNAGNTIVNEVRDFDTTGTGASSAAAFNVGAERAFEDLGGISLTQQFEVGKSGVRKFGADVAAATGDFLGFQSDAGLFELIINGTILDSVDFARIDPNDEERDSLFGSTFLNAGTNTFSIRITRGFINSSITPIQYVDNAFVTPVPLPAGFPLLLAGLGVFGLVRSRKKAT